MSLKKVLGTFVNLNDPVKTTVTPAQPVAPSAPFFIPTPPGVAFDRGAPDQKTLSLLQQAVDNATPPAFKQFDALLKTLTFISDEGQRFLAAFKSGESAQGLTIAALRDAAAQRLAKLEEENSGFQQELAQSQKQELGGRERNIADVDRQLAALDAQRAALVQSKATLQAEIAQIQSGMSAGVTRFQQAYESLKVQFTRDLELINRYLKP